MNSLEFSKVVSWARRMEDDEFARAMINELYVKEEGDDLDDPRTFPGFIYHKFAVDCNSNPSWFIHRLDSENVEKVMQYALKYC